MTEANPSNPADESIPLAEPTEETGTPPVPDTRPLIPEPLPVRIVAVSDVRLLMTAGLEEELDAFYGDLLGFQREGVPRHRKETIDPGMTSNRQWNEPYKPPPVALGFTNEEEAPQAFRGTARTRDDAILGPVYRAENYRVFFEVFQGPVARDGYRPLVVEVGSLPDTEAKMIELALEHTRQRGVTPGSDALVLLDPAGNWVEVVERRIVP